MAPLLRLRARGSAAREDAYHLRHVRLLLQRRGRRAWEQEREQEEEGGKGGGVGDYGRAGQGQGGEWGGGGGDCGRAEEQLLLDLVHRIRAPHCLCQVG